jgi:hypothetical protein
MDSHTFEQLKKGYKNYLRAGEKTRAAIVLVNYILEKRAETNPDAAWERLPWPIQYFPLWYRYKRDLKKISAVNPGMGGLGGLMGASKSEIYSHLSPDYLPQTIYCEPDETRKDIARRLNEQHVPFPEKPLICKPDVGERSAGVEKVYSMQELYDYLDEAEHPFLVQEVIEGPEEYALTCRYSFTSRSMYITHLVWRKIPRVKGDGKQTVAELLEHASVTSQQREKIRGKLKQEILDRVPAAGEIQPLSHVAALSYGTEILPVNLHAYKEETEHLEELINTRIFHNGEGDFYEGIYYCRFDIRGKNHDEILRGSFKILEMNGAAAMPLHICVTGLELDERYRQLFDFYDNLLVLADYNQEHGIGEFISLPKLAFYLRKQIKESKLQSGEVKESLKEILAARKELKS